MNRDRGTSLIEILVALVILALLARIVIPGVRQRMLDGKIAAEDAALVALQADITRTFELPDFAAGNLLLSDDTPTALAAAQACYLTTPALPTSALAAHWFVKVARVRGNLGGSSAAPASLPVYAEILKNSFGQMRLFITGPAESTQQRYLLISLLARPEELTFPPYVAGSAWFDAVWNTDWNNRLASLPAALSGSLSAGQVAAWNGGGGPSQLYRVRVAHLTVQRYPLNVSNTHPTDNLYLTWGEKTLTGTSPYDPFVALARSGAPGTNPTVLAGRAVSIYSGANPSTARLTRTLIVRADDDKDILCQ